MTETTGKASTNTVTVRNVGKKVLEGIIVGTIVVAAGASTFHIVSTYAQYLENGLRQSTVQYEPGLGYTGLGDTGIDQYLGGQ